MTPASALAQQQTAGRETSSRFLPNTPVAKLEPRSSPEHSDSVEASASVTVTVLDVTGAGAEVSLKQEDGTPLRTMASDAGGEFNNDCSRPLPGGRQSGGFSAVYFGRVRGRERAGV